MAKIATISTNTRIFIEIHLFYFWDEIYEKKKFCDTVENSLILMKEYGPYGPQGPWAHKTKMFLLSSYYVVIIILIMMIQGQGPRPGPKKGAGPVPGPGPAPFLGHGLGPWPWIIMIRMMMTT